MNVVLFILTAGFVAVMSIFCIQVWQYSSQIITEEKCKRREAITQTIDRLLWFDNVVELMMGRMLIERRSRYNTLLKSADNLLNHSLEFTIQVSRSIIRDVVTPALKACSDDADSYLAMHHVLKEVIHHPEQMVEIPWIKPIHEAMLTFAAANNVKYYDVVDIVHVHLSWPPTQTQLYKSFTTNH